MSEAATEYQAVRGPKDIEERKCTDVFCLIIFGLCWLVLAIIYYTVFVFEAALRVASYLPLRRVAHDVFVWIDVISVLPFFMRIAFVPRSLGIKRASMPLAGARASRSLVREQAARWRASKPLVGARASCALVNQQAAR